ncbi:hypothetical protein [Actinomycetospora lemnae]|uniref:Bacteriocin biosynthesis cyclodehydratase domain-containing protein n=1 Tax=Actinomycetospora lemnae TaxID=3019891 RepID=A0ABT5SQQ9_9PSEU|nr:hypothetical protein [Actinomycetospora sp. DW7H6]MDD7965188.1 hypothetical protein [Actinomycetospora sp. DW7H6]
MLPAPVTSLTPIPPLPDRPLPDRPLPDRPRLRRPALHRSAGVLQFGAGAPDVLVVDGLTPPLARMVATLDGTRPVARVLAEAVAAGSSPAAAQALLDRLHAAGLLAAPAAAPTDRRVVVRGAGRVGVAIASLLAAAGVGRVLVEAGGVVTRDDLGTGLLAADVGRPAQAAAQDAVARSALAPPPPGTPPARRWLAARADLVVLAEGARPDALAAHRLVLDGRAHLPVAAEDGTGWVGPLVLPGATPCLRCDDLARTDDDAAWPRVAAELAAHRAVVPVALAAATAAVAVTEVLAVLDGGPAVTRGVVLALGPDGARDARPVRRHPGCGCDALRPRRAGTGGRDITSGATVLVTEPGGPVTTGAA